MSMDSLAKERTQFYTQLPFLAVTPALIIATMKLATSRNALLNPVESFSELKHYYRVETPTAFLFLLLVPGFRVRSSQRGHKQSKRMRLHH